MACRNKDIFQTRTREVNSPVASETVALYKILHDPHTLKMHDYVTVAFTIATGTGSSHARIK